MLKDIPYPLGKKLYDLGCFNGPIKHKSMAVLTDEEDKRSADPYHLQHFYKSCGPFDVECKDLMPQDFQFPFGPIKISLTLDVLMDLFTTCINRTQFLHEKK